MMKPIDIIILFFILAICLLFAEKSHACERLNAGYVSYHFERTTTHGEYYDEQENKWIEAEWNENNKGIGCEFNGYGIQQYKNSYFVKSVNLYYYKKFYARELTDNMSINWGPQIGIVSGYTDNFFPYVVPRVDVNFMALTLTTILMGDTGLAFSLQVNI